MRHKTLAPLVYCAARIIGVTLRIQTIDYDRAEEIKLGKIYTGWHGRSFVPVLLMRGKGAWALISQSRDGDIQNGIFTRFGFRTIRGSTGRGGVRAAAESIRILKRNETLAFTPDGPRGPSGVVQSGIIVLAKKSGAALIPVGVAANRCWLAPTWDRYMVPFPFSKCVVYFGSPIFVSKDAEDDEVEKARLLLEEHMHKNQARADAHFKK